MIRQRMFRVLMMIGLFCLSNITTYAQGWEKEYSPDKSMQVTSLFQLQDQSYIMSGFTLGKTNTRIMKLANNGNVLWARDYDTLANISWGTVTQDGGYLMIAYAFYDTTPHPYYTPRALLKVDASGNKQWIKIIPSFANLQSNGGTGNMSLDTTDNGGFVYTHNTYDSAATSTLHKVVTRTNGNGDTIWTRKYFDTDTSLYFSAIKNSGDGGFIVTMPGGTVTNGGNSIFKIDGTGKQLWQYKAPFASASLWAKVARDGNILIYGGYYTNNDLNKPVSYIGKINQSGQQLWVKEFTGLADTVSFNCVVEGNNNTYASIGIRNSGTFSLIDFIKTDSAGNVLLQRRVPQNFQGKILFPDNTFIGTADAGYIFGAWLTDQPQQYSTVLIKMDSNGVVYPHLLTGVTFMDGDSNCVQGAGEMLLKQSVLQFTNATDSFVVASNDSGFYSVGLNDGNYQLQVTPAMHYTQLAACNPKQISIQGVDTILPLGLVPTSYGAYVTVDGYTRQRLCFPMTYKAQYCNNGTAPFSGTIDITFDSTAVVDSASTPWITPQTGNTYQFRVDNMGLMDCAKLEVHYHRPCDQDLMGRTFCIDADVHPDTIATAPTAWDKSNLLMSVACAPAQDSVIFTLKNVGTGKTTGEAKFIVIEDNVISWKNIAQLAAGAQYTQKQKANGSTWRATIAQSVNNPYSSYTTAAIEGCGTNVNGNISKHYYTQYPNNGYYAFHYSTCTEIVNSMDPNHKSVSPTGAGESHLVDSTATLEYTIDFQNTGTDTAYLVRVVDTLADYLDIATIKPGMSSHPYEMQLNDNHTLTFSFYNINLPDSGHNQEASNGFVKFRIDQKHNNTNGTVINNDAAIYFDYNAPVITNTATVTVGRVLFSDIENLYTEKQVLINAYPNPFNTQAVIRIDGEHFDQLQLTVYDMSGKVVKQQYGNNTNQVSIDRNGFSNGTYIFEIRSHEKMIGRGKLSVE